jgi:hypothetical protein
MEQAVNLLTRISMTTVTTISLAICVMFLAGPNNWATHFAYHNWNVISGFFALHYLAQGALIVVTTTLAYLQFEEKIRFVATSLFYSEQAAVERVQANKARAAALRASQLLGGSTPPTGA